MDGIWERGRLHSLPYEMVMTFIIALLNAVTAILLTSTLMKIFTDFKKYTLPDLKDKWWWKRAALSITVRWPVGDIEVGPNRPGWNGLLGQSRQWITSSDPNDHYRPWLEEHVGEQHKDWDWKLAKDNVNLVIGFAKGKEEYAVQASLMWN